MTLMGSRTAALVLGALLVALLGAPAAGQTERPDSGGGATHELLADGQGWASSVQVDAVGDPLANSTMQPGDLPVGVTGTEESKRSYLLLDVPTEATAVILELGRSESPGTTFGTPGVLLACLVTDPFVVSNGQSISEAPAVDCEDEVTGQIQTLEEGVEDPEGGYTFDLTPLLANRDKTAVGPDSLAVAIVGDARAAATYQVTLRADYFAPIGTYTVPAGGGTEGEPAVPPPPTEVSTQGPADPPPAAERPVVPFEVFTAPPQVSSVPVPEVAPQTGAGEPAAPPPGQPVLAATELELMPVNPAVWLLAPLLLVVLWAAGRGLGRAGEPPSALDRLLVG